MALNSQGPGHPGRGFFCADAIQSNGATRFDSVTGADCQKKSPGHRGANRGKVAWSEPWMVPDGACSYLLIVGRRWLGDCAGSIFFM
jgi:hypothetical protein